MISLFAIIIPTIKDNKLHSLDASSLPIYYSLQSTEFKYALIISLSISIPLLLELCIRIFLMKKSLQLLISTVVPNAVTLLLLTVPDLIMLFYLTVSANISIFGLLMIGRLLLLQCVMLIMIRSSGGPIWTSRGIILTSSTSCVARILGFYRQYFSVADTGYYTMDLTALLLNIITLICFIYLSVRWFYHIYQETKTKLLTTNQYLCNTYTAAGLICIVGLTVNQQANKNAIDWLQWDANALTIHILMFTVFYIFIIVFEGRAMQREMIQTKVRLTYLVQCNAYNYEFATGGTRNEIYVYPLLFA